MTTLQHSQQHEKKPTISECNAVIDTFMQKEGINRNQLEFRIRKRTYAALWLQHQYINMVSTIIHDLSAVVVLLTAFYVTVWELPTIWSISMWSLILIVLYLVLCMAAMVAVKIRFSGESLTLYFQGWRCYPAAFLQELCVKERDVLGFIDSHMLTVLWMQSDNQEAFDDIDTYESVRSGKETRAHWIELILCQRVLECWNGHYTEAFKWGFTR